MHRFVLAAVTAAGVIVAAPAVATASTPAITNGTGNLIHNGNAEGAPGSADGSTVAVPDWTLATGTTFTAVQYGASGGFPAPGDEGPRLRGTNFFAGGSGGPLEVATQNHSISNYQGAIDAGVVLFTLQGFLGGYGSQTDRATLTVDWLSRTGSVLGSAGIGPVKATNRQNTTSLLSRKATGTVPVGTRRFLVTLTLIRDDGSYDDGYADNLSLRLGVPDGG